MKLENYLIRENIFIGNSFRDTDSFYAEFAKFLKKRKIIEDNEKVKRLFIRRENVQSTAVGKGAAAPHIFSKEFKEFFIAAAYIRHGLDFKAPDNQLVYLVFLIMSDEREVGLHLKSLAHLARMINDTEIVESIKKSRAEDIYDTFLKFEKQIQT